MLEAAGSMIGRYTSKTLGLTSGPKTEQQEREEAARAHGRRTVTVSGGGLQDAGVGYESINTAISRTESPRELSASIDELSSIMGPLTEAVKALLEEQKRSGSPPLKRPGS